MNQFEAALYFYKSYDPFIMDTPQNEWAGDPYAWDPFIQLTPIEAFLWSDIRDAGVILYPQYPIGRYFADFANPRAKVVIECDGKAYHQDKAKDDARDEWMRSEGWSVYRITGAGCRSDFNEETHEYGAGRRFVEMVGNRHAIKRDVSNKRPVLMDVSSLMEHLIKMNQS